MVELESIHINKKPRLVASSGSAIAGLDGQLPTLPVKSVDTIAPALGAPQSPFPSVLESEGDGADSDLYLIGEFDHDGEKGLRIGKASRSFLSSEDAAISALSVDSLGNTRATTSAFVSNIPGLFLLEDGKSELPSEQQLHANMDLQAQWAIERCPTTGATHDTIALVGCGGGRDIDMMEKGSTEEIIDVVDRNSKVADACNNHHSSTVEQTPDVATEIGIGDTTSPHQLTSAIRGVSIKLENLAPPVKLENLPPFAVHGGDDSMAQHPVEPGANSGEVLEEPLGVIKGEYIDKGKGAYDPEFLAAAEANKDDEGAEWQFDTSDAESSNVDTKDSNSSDSGSDSDSDSESCSQDSDSEYPRLSLEEQARILIADGEEDGERSTSKGEMLRTKNELPEDTIEVQKPDVMLTASDVLEELGEVHTVVGKLALIKAKVSGEYQVLNEGSVLALENRVVIGEVADLLGRVQSPLYTVRFATRDEIKEQGITIGTKVFFSPKHSSFVFTKALRAQKGSDASNLHDEEVDENEVEFSDDEAEAEYKRMLKEKRGVGMKGNSRRPLLKETNLPSSVTPSILSSDEPYTPLARPPDLPELMKSVAHLRSSEEHNEPRNRADKAVGTSSRGVKGGRREERHGGGRGGYHGRGGGGSGYGWEPQSDSPATEAYASGAIHCPQPHQQSPTTISYQQNHQLNQQPQPVSQYGYHLDGFTQLQPTQPPQQSPSSAQFPFQCPTPTTQAQPNYPYQNHTVYPQPHLFASSPLSPPIPKLPQGAHVNPAFLARQAQAVQQQGYFHPQMMWAQQHQSPSGQFNWAQPQQQADAVMKAVQDRLDILKGVKK